MKTALVIEDNVEIQENTVEILELAGYSTVSASNGEEGISLATTTKFDIILCDIIMPGMNGYEVIQAFKKNPATARVPFIYVSANAEKRELEKAMSLGADGYVCKPFDSPDLITAIERSLLK